jgi:hypothetical protein
MYRKSRGLGPRVEDHGRVALSTVDRWWCRQDGVRVQRRAHQSMASGHSGARELAGGCGKCKAEHRGPVLRLTGAQVAVWWLGNDDEVVAEEKLGSGSAQASEEGGKRGGGCGENQWRSLSFIGAVRW